MKDLLNNHLTYASMIIWIIEADYGMNDQMSSQMRLLEDEDHNSFKVWWNGISLQAICCMWGEWGVD